MHQSSSKSHGVGLFVSLFVVLGVFLLAAAQSALASTTVVLKLHAAEGSDFSRYRLYVDGVVVSDSRVSEKSWVYVQLEVPGLDDGLPHEIALEHYYDTRDRALYVDWIKVGDQVIDAASGVQDVGAQDGENLRTGADAEIFYWNGVLYLDVPAQVAADDGAADDRTTDGGTTDGETGDGETGDGGSTDGDTTVGDIGDGGSTDGDSGDGSTTDGDTGGEQTQSDAADAYFHPPLPLNNLRIYNVKPSGFQKVTGGANEDLLLVSPGETIDGKFQMHVEGFRGVYWIGATFDPDPAGTLVSPNGKTVKGIGALIKIRTHPDAQGRPFIYLDRMRLKTSKIKFGDFLQLGGAAGTGDWGDWPDVYRCRMLADPLYGWRGYYGGSFSKHVSKSDFTKFDMGGVRHSYAAMMDVTWGYQSEFLVPTWASGKQPYSGPDGKGSASYWDTVVRAVTDSSIKSYSRPKSFFLARSSDEVSAGNHISYYLYQGDDNGKGVFSVPVGVKGSAKPTVHPSGGSYAPRDHGSYLDWPSSPRHPFVKGRLQNGAAQSVPVMVREGDTGYGRRVTDRASLIAAVEAGCGR